LLLDIIPIHPDFTLWILANRPGFPFHGNDFYREVRTHFYLITNDLILFSLTFYFSAFSSLFQVGDCLSSHAIPNPDPDSEMMLLQSYAPNVDPTLLRQIVHSFDELRQLSEQGELSYPYSTREAGMFPNESHFSHVHMKNTHI
jgi:von Willebrand factor A domain-containing protein 8